VYLVDQKTNLLFALRAKNNITKVVLEKNKNNQDIAFNYCREKTN